MAPAIVKEDYYAILGVSKTADTAALKAAWKRLVRIKHPDKNPGNPNATEEFQLLECAYSTLIDPNQRKKYDEERFVSSGTNKSNGTNRTQNQRRRSASAAAPAAKESCNPPTPPPSPGNKTWESERYSQRSRLAGLESKRAAYESDIRKGQRRLSELKLDHYKLLSAALELIKIEQNSHSYQSVSTRNGSTTSWTSFVGILSDWTTTLDEQWEKQDYALRTLKSKRNKISEEICDIKREEEEARWRATEDEMDQKWKDEGESAWRETERARYERERERDRGRGREQTRRRNNKR
ncbi:hypothetical protein AAE478_009546 [Parahypoxylon ruwenzoriense]